MLEGLKRISAGTLPGCVILLFLLVFFSALGIPRLRFLSGQSRLSADTVQSSGFRRQTVPTEAAERIRKMDAPGSYLAVYWLETRFGETGGDLTEEEAAACKGQRDGAAILAHARRSGMTWNVSRSRRKGAASGFLLKTPGCLTGHTGKSGATRELTSCRMRTGAACFRWSA